MFQRIDFVLHANYEANPSKAYENSDDSYQMYHENLDGKRYQHNLGVFAIHFDGLLLCQGPRVSSEALLVYHKRSSERKTAEVELAALYEEYVLGEQDGGDDYDISVRVN